MVNFVSARAHWAIDITHINSGMAIQRGYHKRLSANVMRLSTRRRKCYYTRRRN